MRNGRSAAKWKRRYCKHKPSEYISQGNWFFAMEPEEETLPYVIERIGDDKIALRLRLSALGWYVSLCHSDHPRPQGHLRAGEESCLGRKRQTLLWLAVRCKAGLDFCLFSY